MFCKKCGNMMPDGSKVCPSCGAVQEQRTTTVNGVPVQPKSVSFLDAVKLYFTRYADFKGRSRRSEYWWAALAIGVVGYIIGLILPDLAWIWTLATLVPSLAICIRRLHDVGKSGWWYLWILLPLIGSIILLVQFCKDSTEDNQWGPNPKR